jgi:hypothetical protein
MWTLSAPGKVVAVGLEAADGGAQLFTRLARKAFIKRSQTIPVLRASAFDDVVVPRSGDCPKDFRFRHRFEQRSAESHWDNIITAAVDEKDRGPNSRDLPARIEPPDEQWTDHWQYGSRHVAGRGEG